MFTQTIEMTQFESSDSYQLIKDEQLASIVITSQTLAGSRILLSTYRHVVFSDCVFYACDFQGVTFDNCVFENCRFEFSHIKKCNFKNCNFTDCTWKASTSTNSSYIDCELDKELTAMTQTGRNQIHVMDVNRNTTDIYIEMALAA